MDIRKLGLIVACAAGMAGCSADPYKGTAPAPPDRLAAVSPAADDASNPGATGSVPAGDGSERAAPNYSGHIPRVTGDK